MHIGRLGALAVALGIGWAVTGMPALAGAESSGSDPQSESSTARTAAHNTTRRHSGIPASPAASATATRASRVTAVRIAGAAVTTPVSGWGPVDAPALAPLAWALTAGARRDFARLPWQRTATVDVTSLTSLAMSPNLLLNPGAEVGDASLSGNSAVSIPGWTLTGTPTVIAYGTPRNMWPVGLSFPTPNLPPFMGFPKTSSGPGDTQFFGGGNVATSTLTQLVTLAGPSAQGVTYDLRGQLGGWLINPGSASVTVDFLDANKTYLGRASIGPVGVLERLFQTTLKERSTTGTLPTGTQYAQVTVTLKAWKPFLPGLNADYNSAFADNLSFTISDPTAQPAQLTAPESVAGPLDHVFMVYMENKGYNDIVGSPNAPFLNSLINNHGFASNYYALTHGSLPNYYPILGGTDYGKTYNCAKACIDATDTLFANLDANQLRWRAYAQSLQPGANPLVSSGDYSFDQTAFPAFTSISNNPAYAAEHIVPLEQMATDLQSTATAPSFAWFAANEDFAGEGPTSFPWGALRFVVNQIDPRHQYNVKALDQFLSQTVPTIMNSAVWDSAESSVIVVTFDEDNNNLSLGFGNEGNHIVTVVIPNQAAIDAGMRGGAFTATSHYNHYSLLRFIEDSLGLPTLTANDYWAAPMNEFWDAGISV